MDKKLNIKLINITVLMVLLYITFNNINLWWNLLAQIIYIMTPFIIAFSLAYILYPLLKYLESKLKNKGLSILIIVLLILGIISLLVFLTIPVIYDQLKLLINSLVDVINTYSDKFDINLGTYSIKITDYLNNITSIIGGFASNTVINIVNKSFSFIGKFIITFVSFIYFLNYMDKIREWIKDIMPNKKTFNYFKTLDKEISSYIRGLIIFMIFQLFEYSIVYFIIGHPNWLILGLLACFTTIIPYFGGLITNIIALILASVISKKLFILTIIVCLIFPQTDGYIVSPRIYSKTNKVNPLVTIMCVSIGGSLFGPIGIIVALPSYLLIRTTYNYYKKDIKNKMNIVKDAL